VWQYVKDVLDQLLAGSTDYESLLPWNWATAHPDQIRQYRINVSVHDPLVDSGRD